MPAAVATVPSAPDQLDLYRLRDDLAQSHCPANAHERMLVTEIAQSWIRLERARDVERRYFEGQDMLEIIRTKLEEFRAVTRYVTDCERAWRHAVVALQKSQRHRQRASLASPNARRSPAPQPLPGAASTPAALAPRDSIPSPATPPVAGIRSRGVQPAGSGSSQTRESTPPAAAI